VAIAKATHKIEKYNHHNETDASARWAGKLAPRDSVWTFLIGNCHNSNRSCLQPTVRAKNIRNVRNAQYCGSFSPVLVPNLK
jgi:hypothetical protein